MLQEALRGDLSESDRGTAHVLLGRLYEKLGRNDAAATQYVEPSVRDSPLWEYADYWRLQLTDPPLEDSARRALWKALFSAGPYASFRIEAAEALLKDALANRETAGAVPYALALHRAEPDDADTTAQLAGLYEDAGRKAEALPLVEDLWARFPTQPATRAFLSKRPGWTRRLRAAPGALTLTRLRSLADARDYRTLAGELKDFDPVDPDQKGWKRYLEGRIAEARHRYASAAAIYRALDRPVAAAMAGVTRMALMAAGRHFSHKTVWEIENSAMDLPLGYDGRATALVALMRARARRKQVERACQLASALLTPGKPQAQADEYLYETAWTRWMSGDPRGAEQLWRVMIRKLPVYSDDRHGAVYCLLRLGLLDSAEERTLLSSEVLREDAFGYFGYRLRDGEPAMLPPLPPPTLPPAEDGGHVHKGDILWEAGFSSAAAAEFQLVPPSERDRSLWWAIGRAQEASGDFRGAILSIRSAYPRAYASPGRRVPVEAWQGIYPLPFRGDVTKAALAAGIAPVLVSSVIRQESLWDKEAVSRSGARGLMQLMLPTARHVARRNGLSRPTLTRLHDPAWNTMAGSAYLAGLLKRYNGRLFLALAAYNAGPSRVDAWLRRPNCPDRPDLFIESIPIRETRSYVRRILLNIWEYGRLYPAMRDLAAVPAADRVYYEP